MRKREFINWRTKVTALVVILFWAALPDMGNAQEQTTPVFAVVEYMKVKQGDEQKYVDLERNYWKKIHQERVNNGEIVRWVLYEVLYAGSNDEYNFVTGTIVTDPAKLEYPFEGIDPVAVLPGEDVDRIMQETNQSRQLVRRNLLSMVSTADDLNPPGPFRYLAVNFMKVKPGGNQAYMDAENSIWKPVHQQFVKDGSRVGWAVWQVVYPSGYSNDFQYATTDYFEDFSMLGAADMQGAFSKVHAGKNIDELMQETDNSRELSRTELWRVVETVP